MSANAQPERLAIVAAEEILGTIYGDDLKGCTVSLEAIATIIDTALKQRAAQDQGIFEMYEKVVEALHLLSTPPDGSKVSGPDALRSLLGERLDTIHALTTKTIATTTRLKSERTGR
jgi:hypothetical protein